MILAGVPVFIFYSLLTILFLSVLIVIHELGHFLMAKRAGVWVEEFGIGLPPRIWGKKIGETLYSLNAVPLGGFVRLHGEVSGEGVSKPNRAFMNKSKLARASIIIAGVVMNLLLGIVAFAIFYSITGMPRETGMVTIYDVAANSPAQTAGILSGDQVVSVNGKEIKTGGEFEVVINQNLDKKVTLEIKRTTPTVVETKKITVIPQIFPEDPEPKKGRIGVTMSSLESYYPAIWQRPFLGIAQGLKDSVRWGRDILLALGGVGRDISKGQIPQGVTGIPGTFGVIALSILQGFLPALHFMAILSINLAILNILPFPALDGSRLMFIVIETITRRKVPAKLEATIHTIGMALLLTLILVVSAREVPKIFTAKSLQGFVESLIVQ